MEILFLSGTRSRAAGGIFEIELALAQTLRRRHGVMMEAAGFVDENSARDNQSWEPIAVHCFKRFKPLQFGYSPGLKQWLKSTNNDVLHLHCLWMYTSLVTLEWHKRTGRPYIVTPHGMLEPWALKNSGWKKRLAGLLYEKRMLRNAAVIHAYHQRDMADIRAYGLRNPIAVIPNGVTLPQRSELNSRRRQILFLGRIHPKKGIKQLILGWNLLSKENLDQWKLTIAGWDDGGHLPELTRLVKSLDLEGSIEFTGPVFGEAKQHLLESSAGFILPSFSEGLPMAVLEAWAYAIPVLMTDMCNLPQGFVADAAIKIDCTPNGIASELNKFLQFTDERRAQMGHNGRLLVERAFSWDKVADDFIDLYRWVLGKGPQPSCINLY